MEKKKHKDNSATKHTYPLGQISQLPNKTLKITEEELKYLVTIWDDLTFNEKEELKTKQPDVWTRLYREKYGFNP